MCLPGNHLKLSELLFFSFSVRFSFICLFFIAFLTIYHMYHVAAFVNIKATQQKIRQIKNPRILKTHALWLVTL